MTAFRFLRCGGLLLSLSVSVTAARAEDSSGTAVNFARDIQPLLASRCLKCHGGDTAEGGLRLTDLTAATKTLDSGSRAIVPQHPEQSELLARVTSPDDQLRMPPEGPRLTEQEIQRLKNWIAAGADWPTHWAYAPLKTPALPAVPPEYREWARTPVDASILSELLARNLKPGEPASRRDLLRRVFFDLIGLPPTAEELEQFLADESPDAYEQAVDRLLASPHYGERQARRWMDLVHYAETHGHDQDRPREHAWPYRDYLIQAFNADLPYARFVQEQVAGDVLWPGDPSALIATGFLATGPWDESSLRDIREDTLDREIARYLDRDDIVTTVMSTFASSTVHCARCHDHKFDPISQREYYALQAVFAATDKGNRPFDANPQTGIRRRELTTALAELPERIRQNDAALLTDDLAREVEQWEQELQRIARRWQPVEVLEFHSDQGSQLQKLEDGSVLAGGTRPEHDTYQITVRAMHTTVTAVRIEVLTDESLPHTGPGRQDNGNLHLNEVLLWQIGDNRQEQPLPLRSAIADFNQEGWSIDKALDGNPATAWGIYPEVGKPHQACFELAQPVTAGGQVTLKLSLQQTHGGGHLIGRVRISTTDLPGPPTLDGNTIAPATAALIRVPQAERTPAQKIELAGAYFRQKYTAELGALPPQQLVYCGSSQFQPDGSFRPSTTPRMVQLLKRGNITSPLEEVPPAALSYLPELPAMLDIENPADEGQRRAALARWLTAPENGVTWRSIANRVWQAHFGAGFVSTPNDFGRMGGVPTHPELLDWLAVQLRDGASLKQVHRLIVTSAVYRQSSADNPALAAIDGDNRYLWRMHRQRLDAEHVRDAVLLISGRLQTRMGGPSDRQFNQSPGIHVTPEVDYVNFDVNHPANYRRSVYRFIFRTLPDPFMEALDCPDSSQLTPERNISLTPLQALAMLNDKTIVHLSNEIALRAMIEAGGDAGVKQQVDSAYRLIFARAPSPAEREAVSAYVGRHGLANACRFLLNSNEFMFVD